MALAQPENIYFPRIFDESEEDMWGWTERAFATWSSPTKQRVDLNQFVVESHIGTEIHVSASSLPFTATVFNRSVDRVRELDPLNSAVVVSSLIDKALRQRCERRAAIEWRHEEQRQQGDRDLRNALDRHIRNQLVAIAANGAQMMDDPDIRDVTRGLIEKLSVLLDESEQVLAAPVRLRDAVRRQVLEEPMFSEHEVATAVHGQLDIGEIRSRRVDSMLLALPTDSGFLYPRFQFDQNGSVYEMVQRINQHLRAADDPWGVASWWFSEHVRLGGRPADLMHAAVAVEEGAASSDDVARRQAAALFAAAQAITDSLA